MIKQLLVNSFAYEFVLDHVIPSLLGYVIIVPILTVLLVLNPGAQLSMMS